MSIFDFKDTEQGGVFVKKVPSELYPELEIMSKLYYEETNESELESSVNHIWYSKSSPELKQAFEKFQNHPFFQKLCGDCKSCKIENVTEMDEIMYSNSSSLKDNSKANYYGATSNSKRHNDCEPCKYIFRNTHLYRIIIGLSENNEYVITSFPNYNIEKNLNKGDMMGFDFDKTTHEVIKTKEQDTPRLLLKLHFLVCENCKLSDTEFNLIKNFYIHYDKTLRVLTKTGTDPYYLHEFIFGLMCHYFYYPNIMIILLVYFILSFILIQMMNKYKLNVTNVGKIVGKSLVLLVCIHLVISFSYWIRFKITGIK
jgi:hypothetical protein